jgi:hypothetical protein
MHVHSVEIGEGNIKSCVGDPVTLLSNSQLIVVCTSQTAENRLVSTADAALQHLPNSMALSRLVSARPECFLGLSSVVAASK